MPIVVAASNDGMFVNVALGAATLVALAIAAAGAFRPTRVGGPDRIGPFGSAWRLVPVVMMGFTAWVFVQLLFGSYIHSQFSPLAAQSRPADVSAHLTPAQWSFLATVPPIVGFLTLLVGDYVVAGAAGLRRLGLGRDRLAGGIFSGLIGAIAILPLLAWFLSFTETFYRWIHFDHPVEHDLLRIMGESSGPIKAVLIGGAVIVAPLFEELLFRGHLQTMIRSLLLRLQAKRRGFPLSDSDAGPDRLEQAYDADQTVSPTWAAIIIASLAFASVHPRWMWPPIFFLSICLGYAYERTKSLWTSMIIHALFNGASTWMYLHSLSSR